MDPKSCKICETYSCFVKKHCSDKWLTIIDQKKIQILLNSNQNIFEDIAPVLGIYFVKSGLIKIHLSGQNGKKQIVRFAKKAQIFGHRGSKNEIYGLNAVTMEKSIICFIENDLLNEIFLKNSEFTVALMMYYSTELRKMENRVKCMAQMNIREKIADALLMIWESVIPVKNGVLDIDNVRVDIANIAGTNVQQVSRQLGDFEEEGILERKGKKISLVNIEKFRDIIKKHK